jgi:Flp pilus assembly pilin Flp
MMLDKAQAGADGKERGQGLVEYSLILSLVSIAVVGALTILGGQSNGLYSQILSVIGSVAASL